MERKNKKYVSQYSKMEGEHLLIDYTILNHMKINVLGQPLSAYKKKILRAICQKIRLHYLEKVNN